MEVFLNRDNSEYRAFICGKLKYENLINSAIPIKGNKHFDKVIRIDFFGLSGASLLSFDDDRKGMISEKFEQVFQNLEKFTTDRVLVKVRFLFSYVYSDFAFSLIEAEKSQNRATVNQQSHWLNFEPETDITEEEFYSSQIFKNQKTALKHLQRLKETYISEETSSHKINIRFSPIPINYCGVLINDFTAFDCYSYSKLNKYSGKLMFSSPVLTLTKNSSNKRKFQEVEDHFRYLWNHELTLFSEDATFFDINKQHSLSKIKKPNEIKFEYKSNKIKELELLRDTNTDNVESRMNSWLFTAKNRLIHNTRIIQQHPVKESIFIACCWKKQDDNSFKPNFIAKNVNNFISKSFGLKSKSKVINTLLVEPNPGSELSVKIYSALKQATLSIIILTDDIIAIDDSIYPTQNVIHELGFMMHKLRARETGRILILKQKDVRIPSNVGNYEYVEFEKEKLLLKYFDIIEWLYEKCATVTHKMVKQTFIKYQEELNEQLKYEKISLTEYHEINRKITVHNTVYN